MHPIPAIRSRTVNDAPVRQDGAYVLYWMTAFRRPQWNFALDHAVGWARSLDRPLLIFEALRVGYPWACDRFHRFVLQGMADNAAYCHDVGVTYFPYVEPTAGAGKGLLARLSQDACVVVGDDFPCFFLPHMLQRAATVVTCRMDVVDSNGLLPLRVPTKDYPTAAHFRRILQRDVPAHLTQTPQRAPLAKGGHVTGARLPADVKKKWPTASAALLRADADALADLPIDHNVGPAAFEGGFKAADACCKQFIDRGLPRYAERSHPDVDSASGLSPYLHFGHISAHAVFDAVARQNDWDITRLSETVTGAKAGFWGMDAASEAFLDELITWREVGLNMCQFRADYTEYSSLPAWAQETLAQHSRDPRPHVYSLRQFEAAQTQDPVWNAAQNQLVRDGRLQNYMRMLWGKMILEWSKTPQEALSIMIELNNKYAVDGRDPNSYSGIFWTLGRYDRPWPERPIFGKIRCMTSASTVKKLQLSNYLRTYANRPGQGQVRPG